MFPQSRYVGFEQQLDAVLAEMIVEQGRHIRIEDGHDVLASLHDRDFKAPFTQVLGHLQPDEAGAYDGGATRLLAVDEVGDCVGVLDSAQREQTLGIDAG